MERIDNLLYFFEKLKDLSWEGSGVGEVEDIALYEKRLYALAGVLYREKMVKKKAPYYVGKFGEIYSGYDIVDYEEGLLEEFTACQSKVTDYLLIYYEENPYWEIRYDWLSFDEIENEMSLIEFFKRKSWVLEERLLSSLEVCPKEHPLAEFHLLYCDADECASDDCVIMISKLMPYFRRAEDSMGVEDKMLIDHVNRMEKVLTYWLSGYSFSITGIEYEYSYYFSCDDSSGWSQYGDGYGVMEHALEIMVAGEIIDRCILILDEKYSFLPQHLRCIRKDQKI